MKSQSPDLSIVRFIRGFHLSETLALALFALALGETNSRGAAIATDDASNAAYAGGWANGNNGGSGFNAWTLTGGATAGFFTGSSAGNGSGTSGNIDTGGKSWGLFANTGLTASAVRTFTVGGPNSASTLAVGQQFVLKLDSGFIDVGGTVGFGLQDSAGVNRLEFFFVGGAAGYTVSDSAPQTTTHGFTADGLTATFTLTGIDSYLLGLSYNTGVPVTETFSGTLKGTAGNGIDRVRIFNANAGTTGSKDAFANSMQVVPEPTTPALIFASLLGLGWIRRRRRA